ncbi:MAG: hypothetical protein M1830_008954 [Pleopsidium flavum]|nr:MAG: hypothetical protein M1830_008954 [Pleopsidium flavum]
MGPQILFRVAQSRSTYVFLGTSLAYGLFIPRSGQLRSDDGHSDVRWPRTRALVTERNAQSDARNGISPIERKDNDIPPPGYTKLSPTVKEEEGAALLPKDDDSAAWASFTNRFATAKDSVSSIEWSSIGDSITGFILPDWARELPGYITKLQREMSMAPGSLADEIWREAHDVDINPEITWDASVRVGKALGREEKAFRRKRKEYTTAALANYLGLKEGEVHPDDVPTIAMCGSGGGLRALVAGAGSYLSAQEAGLFDCVTYTAGVSGSCWLQTLYNSSLGGRRHDKLVEHLKNRIGVHIAFPLTALSLLNTAPTNKFLLSGFVEKLKGNPTANFGLVDIYGLMLAARLLVPRGELGVEDRDLKISNQRAYVDRGFNPMPIYTAVRHEIPIEEEKTEKERIEGGASESTKERAKQEAWFQWFEFTPYELWCEEIEAGIPTWSIGRQFMNGRNVLRDDGLAIPEMRVPLMMGMWGSAFCATLSHYYKEIRPVVKSLAIFGGVDELIEERNDDLIKVHPIEPSSIPNFALGMRDRLPSTSPESIFKSSHLQLMDAGMSNNLPIYPLLRPGRDVDILIAFDASADIKTENWLSVVDGYARQRGIKGWPIGAGWPKADAAEDATVKDLDAAEAVSPQEAAVKIADAREEQRETNNRTQQAVKNEKRPNSTDSDLGYCTVWVGTTEERTSSEEPPHSKRVDSDFELMAPNAGIAVIYFPFLPNAKVNGVDPNTSEFMSTWNFIYTPEEIDQVVSLARANFDEGKEQTRKTVRAVYERKKAKRLAKEEADRIQRWRRQLRDHGDHFR